MDQVPLSLVTLRFAPLEVEKDFVRASAKQSLLLIRVAVALGCTLYALFGILDLWIVPQAVTATWSIRGVVCTFLLVVLVASFRPRLLYWVRRLAMALVLVTGLGIVAMVAAADPDQGAPYYAGLILVIIFSHGLLRLRFVVVSALTGVVIAAYVAVVLVVRPTPPVVLANNLFFLLSAQVICMFVSYSLEYYGRRVFWQRRILNEQERRLRVEHERKSRELEEVRALQLAMLPRVLPEHPEVEIAVHMRTATEVGGDFYDVHVADDGTLTCVIGDATGHGARAGAIVTGMKMLLTCLHDSDDLAGVLRTASATFKRTTIPGMQMSLALVRLRRRSLELAGAGMPPALLYRAATGRVEEVPLSGMPVGALAGFPYRSRTVEVGAGDTLILMSDGFPELSDGDDGILGYERATASFAEVASRPCEEIIGHLARTGESWTGATPPGDDVTFVVLKVRPRPAARAAAPTGALRSPAAARAVRPRPSPAGLERRTT